jgi:hypothetical protein
MWKILGHFENQHPFNQFHRIIGSQLSSVDQVVVLINSEPKNRFIGVTGLRGKKGGHCRHA